MRTTFTNRLTPAEYHLALRAVQRHAASRISLRHLLTFFQFMFGVAAGVALVHLVMAGGLPRDFRYGMVAMFVVAFIGAQWLAFRGVRSLANASLGKVHGSQETVEVGDDGIDLH